MNIGWVPGYSSSWQNTGKYLVNIGELDTYAEFLDRLRKMMGAVGACRDNLSCMCLCVCGSLWVLSIVVRAAAVCCVSCCMLHVVCVSMQHLTPRRRSVHGRSRIRGGEGDEEGSA